MSAELAIKEPLDGKALENFIVRGDLSVLGQEDKAKHYLWVCGRVGLDPATKPLEYIKLNGKEVLYCKKEGTDQLRKVHCVAITITQRERIDDVYVVTARAQMPDGRTDESQGAVTIAGMKGDSLANAIMKAETKAKRRVTLSIVGLGVLDESELETIPQDRFASLRPEAPPSEAPKADVRPETLPPIPEVITTIPDLLLRPFRQLHHLHAKPMSEMPLDDLELVIETIGKAYEQRKNKGNTSELGLAWLRAIIATATIAVGGAK